MNGKKLSDILVVSRINRIFLRKAIGYIWVCESDLMTLTKITLMYSVEMLSKVWLFLSFWHVLDANIRKYNTNRFTFLACVIEKNRVYQGLSDSIGIIRIWLLSFSLLFSLLITLSGSIWGQNGFVFSVANCLPEYWRHASKISNQLF